MFDFDELTDAEKAHEPCDTGHNSNSGHNKTAVEVSTRLLSTSSVDPPQKRRVRASAFAQFVDTAVNAKQTATAVNARQTAPLVNARANPTPTYCTGPPVVVGSPACATAASPNVSSCSHSGLSVNDDSVDCEDSFSAQPSMSSNAGQAAPDGADVYEGQSKISASANASITCDKCDGPHATDKCPHFKGSREEHKDAWVNYGKEGNPHQMGEDGGNHLLQSARVVSQPGDGSCLFHSLNHGLSRNGLNSTSSAYNLRHEIADFVQGHPQLEIAGDTLEQWVKWDSNCSVREYVERMETGAWGGGIEMAACAHLKEVNVHVYERCGSAYKRISCFGCNSAAKTITVLYQGRMHYDALVPM